MFLNVLEFYLVLNCSWKSVFFHPWFLNVLEFFNYMNIFCLENQYFVFEMFLNFIRDFFFLIWVAWITKWPVKIFYQRSMWWFQKCFLYFLLSVVCYTLVLVSDRTLHDYPECILYLSSRLVSSVQLVCMVLSRQKITFRTKWDVYVNSRYNGVYKHLISVRFQQRSQTQATNCRKISSVRKIRLLSRGQIQSNRNTRTTRSGKLSFRRKHFIYYNDLQRRVSFIIMISNSWLHWKVITKLHKPNRK